ncbi:hypothetical protein ANCCEY_03433 [Ancylostoma ceylanicum]|uniref:RIMS-binding protein 1/2/3 Fn3 domain-containing protein n=1 Tax=Ancylostoma ceylanicum TaxID=53326 RepID=A0A0D6LZJ2_9BILA|nr:hypothetical protein ANCCEY_03433 [Ancylostoma ceylanicum]
MPGFFSGFTTKPEQTSQTSGFHWSSSATRFGLPDPPTNVQAENGPQAGTLLVSWTPVTNQPKPPSRAAVHSYLIYADGKNIAQVPSATEF